MTVKTATPATPVSTPVVTIDGAARLKSDMAGLAKCSARDAMTTTDASLIWHRNYDLVPAIDLAKSETLGFGAWDVNRVELLMPISNKPSGVFTLVGTDDNKRIGKSFEESFVHISNAETRAITGEILAGIAKLGVTPEIVTSGSVEDRELIFISIRIQEMTGFAIDGREFKLFLNIHNGFAKNSNFIMTNSGICVCCANTNQISMMDKSGVFRFALPHRKNVKPMIAEAVKLIPATFDAAMNGNKAFEKQLKAFASIGITDTEAENIFAWFLGKPSEDLTVRTANQIERLKTLFKSGKGNKGQTLFDVFQSCTEYYTHESAGESDNVLKQFTSSEFGTSAEKKNNFYSALCAMVADKKQFDAVGHIGNQIMVAYNKAEVKKTAAN